MDHNPPNLNFGNLEKAEQNAPVPASVTLLVSLFLILLVFFIIINRNAEYNNNKKETIIKSLNQKFGMPTDDQINFGTIIPPKVEDFVVELEQLFETNANIKSTVNGDETIITAPKNYFFFSDETSLRQDRLQTLIKLQDILTRWSKAAKIKITLTMTLDDYDLDRERIKNFRQIISLPNIDIGLDTGSKDNFTINIKYDSAQ